MHIAILGATGGTGRQLVTQALDRGHVVRAVARRPSAVGIKHPRLQIVSGDVFNRASLRDALQGVETAVFAVGVANMWEARKPTTIYSAGVRNLAEAARAASVRRIVIISSSGTDPKTGDPWWFTRLVKPLFLAGMYADMRVMEREIATQPLSWTIVRPPQLLDGLWTGVYRTAKNSTVPNDGDLTRGDLAHFILDEIEEGQHLNAKVDIAY